jgi:hypothetical protein
MIGYGFALATATFAIEPTPIVRGAWPGYPHNGAIVSKLVVRDSVVWATMGEGGAQAFDISNPAEPVRLGGIDVNDWYLASDIAFKDNRAFVAAGKYGLSVLNIRDPKNPVPAVPLIPDFSGLVSVAIGGNLAFAANGAAAIGVFDISNPAELGYVTSISNGHFAYSLTVVETNLFVANWQRGFSIFNIADPLNAQLVATQSVSAIVRRITVRENLAFLAAGEAGLQIFDIADPTHPTFAGAVDTSNAFDVAVAGNFAYVADWGAGVKIVDIHDVTRPVIVAEISASSVASVVVTGSKVIFGGGWGNLSIYDVSDPTHPTRISGLNPSGTTHAIAVKGDYVYLAHGGGGLKVIDATDRTQPRLVGEAVPPGASSMGVAVEGNYAFVAADWNGLEIYDIGNPRNPTLINSIDTPGVAFSVATANGFAYVTDSTAGIHVIDVRVPALPAVRNTKPGILGGKVKIDGTRLYVQTWETPQLQIFDISQPPAVLPIGAIAGGANDFSALGNVVCVSASDGLRIFDVTDPVRPQLLALYDQGTAVDAIAMNGDFIYLGFETVDFSDHHAPRRVGFGYVGAAPIKVVDGKLYGAGRGGITILDLPVYLEAKRNNSNGAFSLRVQALKEMSGRLQRATVFGEWTDWKTLTLGASAQEFPDNGLAAAAVFYRLVSP